MAISDNTQGTNMAQAMNEALNNKQPQQQAQSRGFSFMKLSGIGGISRTPASEALTRAMTALQESVKVELTDKAWECSLLPVDNNKETNLAFSSIVVVMRAKDARDIGAAYHTLILEDSAEPLPLKVENFRGTQYEVQRVTGDAYNEVYHNAVAEIVARAFPQTNLIPQGAKVIPRGFNFDDKDALHDLTVDALLPCVTALETRRKEFHDVDLTQMEKDTSLQVRLAFNEEQRSDYLGLPQRNDISIVLSAVSMNRSVDQQQINAQERSKQIARVGGYIDPVWAPEQQMANQYYLPPGMPQPKFVQRFVITNMENVLLSTIPSQLLALCASLVLRENNNSFPYFAPRPLAHGSKVDPRDVGALNIEGNMSNNPGGFDQYIDTKSATFSNIDLGRLLMAMFRPGMLFSLRVSEAGSDNWYNGVFKAAADGNQSAINAILHATDVLTGGIFSKIYNSSENPVIQNMDRVHTGYYIGADGKKHDIADIDYLAIMNLVGRTNPEAGASWSDTFFKEDLPLHMRLSARKKMIEDVLHTTVTYTGFARLVTFNNRYLDSLAKACAQAGLDIKTINPDVTGDFFTQRAQIGYLNQAMVAPGQSNIFHQGWSNQGGLGQAYTGFEPRRF